MCEPLLEEGIGHGEIFNLGTAQDLPAIIILLTEVLSSMVLNIFFLVDPTSPFKSL